LATASFARITVVGAKPKQCLLSQLVAANKFTPELIYNANTKGPWSETRGPKMRVPVPRS